MTTLHLLQALSKLGEYSTFLQEEYNSDCDCPSCEAIRAYLRGIDILLKGESK